MRKTVLRYPNKRKLISQNTQTHTFTLSHLHTHLLFKSLLLSKLTDKLSLSVDVVFVVLVTKLVVFIYIYHLYYGSLLYTCTLPFTLHWPLMRVCSNNWPLALAATDSFLFFFFVSFRCQLLVLRQKYLSVAVLTGNRCRLALARLCRLSVPSFYCSFTTVSFSFYASFTLTQRTQTNKLLSFSNIMTWHDTNYIVHIYLGYIIIIRNSLPTTRITLFVFFNSYY